MCEWLGDVSLPANTTLSLSINKPRATAESTSLGETKLSRELAPVTAVSLSLDVTAATQGCGSLSQGWAGTKAGAGLSPAAPAGPEQLQGAPEPLGSALWPHNEPWLWCHCPQTQKPKNCPGRLGMCNLRKLQPSWDCLVTKIKTGIPYKCVYLRYSHL